MRDPVTGNYTITYVGESAESLSQTVFVPSTKIEPTIRSRFHQERNNALVYRYTVSNGASAKQPITGVLLDGIARPIIGEVPLPGLEVNVEVFNAYLTAIKAATSAPVNWEGDITRNDELKRVSWSPKTGLLRKVGIVAGQTLTGFGFNSPDLPGIGESKMDGLGEIFGFPDDGPVQSSAILNELNRLRDNDFVTRPAAIPAIAIPTPFNAAILLDRIRSEMLTWPGKQLLDPAYSVQLDRYLTSAADAYRLNNPKAGKEHIATLRQMLAKEHHHLDHDDEDEDDTDERKAATRSSIDRLAARVLDFNLRYVMKRIEQRKDNERQHEH